MSIECLLRLKDLYFVNISASVFKIIFLIRLQAGLILLLNNLINFCLISPWRIVQIHSYFKALSKRLVSIANWTNQSLLNLKYWRTFKNSDENIVQHV